MKTPSDYELPRDAISGGNLSIPRHERRRQDAGLACLLIGGILGLIAGFLIGLAF
jgi:hypothetical protein